MKINFMRKKINFKRKGITLFDLVFMALMENGRGFLSFGNGCGRIKNLNLKWRSWAEMYFVDRYTKIAKYVAKPFINFNNFWSFVLNKYWGCFYVYKLNYMVIKYILFTWIKLLYSIFQSLDNIVLPI